MAGSPGLLAALAARLASNGASTSSSLALRTFSTSLTAEIRREPTPVKPSGGALLVPLEAGQVAETQPPNQDLVRQVLGEDMMSSSERMQAQLTEVRLDFQRAEGDTGSPEVQAALLTSRIKHIASHLTTHRKDHHTRRGLSGLLSRRRKLLQYLRRDDFDAYTVLLVRLGLKDNYAKKDRLTLMQKPGTKSGTKKKR